MRHVRRRWQVGDMLDAASLRNGALRLVDEDVPLAAVCEHVMHLTKAVLKKARYLHLYESYTCMYILRERIYRCIYRPTSRTEAEMQT